MTSQSFLARTMGFRARKFPTKYLGIQLCEKQNKIANWEGLMGKIQKRMDNWTFRALNTLSCIILLKSVFQSIPIDQMTSQAIPKTICQKMVEIFCQVPIILVITPLLLQLYPLLILLCVLVKIPLKCCTNKFSISSF